MELCFKKIFNFFLISEWEYDRQLIPPKVFGSGIQLGCFQLEICCGLWGITVNTVESEPDKSSSRNNIFIPQPNFFDTTCHYSCSLLRFLDVIGARLVDYLLLTIPSKKETPAPNYRQVVPRPALLSSRTSALARLWIALLSF